MFKKLVLMIAAMMFGIVSAASATFMFSDVGMTSNTLTFTIDGDMTGYAWTGGSYNSHFSIGYEGDIFTTTGGNAPNSWTTSVFDNENININGEGHTLTKFGYNYSWSWYTNSLWDAVAADRTVTLTLGNYLNPTETGIVSFYWGSVNSNPVLLGSVDYDGSNPSAPVPEPATCLLLGIGLFGMVAVGRKKFNKS